MTAELSPPTEKREQKGVVVVVRRPEPEPGVVADHLEHDPERLEPCHPAVGFATFEHGGEDAVTEQHDRHDRQQGGPERGPWVAHEHNHRERHERREPPGGPREGKKEAARKRERTGGDHREP